MSGLSERGGSYHDPAAIGLAPRYSWADSWSFWMTSS